MSLFIKKPEVIEINIGDGSAYRYVAGKSLDEVIEAIDGAFGVPVATLSAPKKARKPRRTKKEMADADGTVVIPDETKPPKSSGKAWAD